METLDAIKKRCSLKNHLSTREVEPEKIQKVLEAATLAPSARNMQPWRFIVVRGKHAVESLVSEAFMDANATVKRAPVVIVVCSRRDDDISRDGKEYYLFDSGLAMENMLLAATDLGLVTHPMTGVNEPEVKKLLKIPDDVRVVIVTPLAYPEESTYESAARERLEQRTRKGADEIIFYDKWSESEPA